MGEIMMYEDKSERYYHLSSVMRVTGLRWGVILHWQHKLDCTAMVRHDKANGLPLYSPEFVTLMLARRGGSSLVGVDLSPDDVQALIGLWFNEGNGHWDVLPLWTWREIRGALDALGLSALDMDEVEKLLDLMSILERSETHD